MSTTSSSKSKLKPVAAKANVAVNKAVQKVAKLATAQVSATTVAKDAKMIEKRIESISKREGTHGSLSRNGVRHGYIERTAIKMTQHGVTFCYRGKERLGDIAVPGLTEAGTPLDLVQLNPVAFGKVLPIYAKPFAKYMFKKTRLHFKPEMAPATTNANNSGSIYFGLNSDPKAEIPRGDAGVDCMATWDPNVMIVAVNRLTDESQEMRLNTESQIPLFVGQSGDDQLDSQGLIAVVSGTTLAPAATATSFGELFIEYEVEFYQLNATQSDIDNGVLIGGANLLPSATRDLNSYTQWYGDGDLIVPEPTGSLQSFIVPQRGTYMIEMLSVCNVAATAVVVPATLWFSEVAGYTDPAGVPGGILYSAGGTALSSGFQNGILSSNTAVNCMITAGSLIPETSTPQPLAAANIGVNIYRWVFTAVAGAIFTLTSPTYTATETSTTTLIISKFDSVFHAGAAIPYRTTPSTNPSYAAERQSRLTHLRICEPSITADEMLKMLNFINANRDKLDAAMLNTLIDKLNLPIPKSPVTTMILPAIAAVASWAVATFGPMLAEKACKWVVNKIEGKK